MTRIVYGKEREQELMARIRQIIVIKPDSSCREISKVMGENSMPITKEYALKLLKKIRGERANRYNNAAAKSAVAEFEDFIKLLAEDWRKLKSSTELDVVKGMALVNLAKNYKTVLDLKFDIGIFERKLGTLKNENYDMVEILKIITNADEQLKQGATNNNPDGDGELPVLPK